MVQIPLQSTPLDQIEMSAGVVHIPDGFYNAVCVDSNIRPNSKGTGQILELTFVITGQEHNGTQLVDRLNVINTNETAVRIALQTLGKIAKALGMDSTPTDTSQIHNRPLQIEVNTEEAQDWIDRDGVVRQGKPKSVIAGYRAAQKIGGAPQVAQQQYVAPQQAPQPAPQAAPAPAKSPFAL